MILIEDGAIQYFVSGTMLENTTMSNTFTSYPTIEGTSFSDHYYREPYSLSFTIRASNASASLVHILQRREDGVVLTKDLDKREVIELVSGWYRNATRLKISSLEPSNHVFERMRLQSYTFTDKDQSTFEPNLSFKETREQQLRKAIIENPDKYYKAEYGSVINVGGSQSADSGFNLMTTLSATGVGAAAGAAIGSVIPGLGTAVGAAIGGAIGFIGSLF